MQLCGCVDRERRRAAVARAAAAIARLNVEREQHFQDAAMGAIRLAQDAFRDDAGSELPGPGDDTLLDALMDLARALESSPEDVGAACDAALDAAAVGAEARAAAP